jgi:hypothetical protein
MANGKYWNWELLISGNSNDLRQLTSGHQSHYIVFSGGVDDWLDCPNDDFRISSIYLGDDDDAHTVSQVGYELLSLFNGASILFQRSRRKLELHGIVRDGSTERLHERGAGVGLLERPNIDDAHFEDFLQVARAHDARTFLLMLATECEDVYQILKYFDMSLDWVTFYKLLESVESHAEAGKIDLKIDKAQRTAFTNTANNYSLSGFESRHGFKQIVKQNKTASMSIDQAYAFIAGIAKQYLGAKYGERGRAKQA